MCHPAILAAVSVAGSLAGAATQASGIRQQADANAKAEERRAEFAERQREVNQARASYERGRTLEHYARVLGNNRASGAERGLSESGSLTDVLNDNAHEAAQNIEAIRYRAEGERGNLTFEAATARERAQSHRAAGRIGARSAILGGLTSAATTLGNAFYSSAASIR
ncbi:virion core protein, T7 gp14 family [Roseibium sp. Sym1]|uniref:virion core protein, T7 gp14 family n=1 Tax=Roseibium sp. Sym1 TaxID=3016006 RepID=UPI0022B333E0|nr:hypothetical protein [Roseibium sp. Sym1]